MRITQGVMLICATVLASSIGVKNQQTNQPKWHPDKQHNNTHYADTPHKDSIITKLSKMTFNIKAL